MILLKLKKLGKPLHSIFLKAIYEIANLNILQIVNDNAYNWNVGPCEIEK